jgi:predicted DNA-binding protein/predicted HicB family RNase H-like nuclease
VQTPPSPHPHPSIRMDAGLDAKTRETLEDLAAGFHRSRAEVLRQVMQWGLGQKRPIAMRVPRRLTSFFFMVDAALHRQVREAAQAAGVDVAPWLRHMMRQIRKEEFPKSWQVRKTEKRKAIAQRSHDSRQYWKRFMLRLDDEAGQRLEELATYFGEPNAEVIRQLIIQVRLDDFPQSWHLAVAERLQQGARREP